MYAPCVPRAGAPFTLREDTTVASGQFAGSQIVTILPDSAAGTSAGPQNTLAVTRRMVLCRAHQNGDAAEPDAQPTPQPQPHTARKRKHGEMQDTPATPAGKKSEGAQGHGTQQQGAVATPAQQQEPSKAEQAQEHTHKDKKHKKEKKEKRSKDKKEKKEKKSKDKDKSKDKEGKKKKARESDSDDSE